MKIRAKRRGGAAAACLVARSRCIWSRRARCLIWRRIYARFDSDPDFPQSGGAEFFAIQSAAVRRAGQDVGGRSLRRLFPGSRASEVSSAGAARGGSSPCPCATSSSTGRGCAIRVWRTCCAILHCRAPLMLYAVSPAARAFSHRRPLRRRTRLLGLSRPAMLRSCLGACPRSSSFHGSEHQRPRRTSHRARRASAHLSDTQTASVAVSRLLRGARSGARGAARACRCRPEWNPHRAI